MDTPFDFSQQRMWEKRDSDKMIKENKISLKMLPGEDLNFSFNNQIDDEINFNNTKPCCSNLDYQSAADQEDIAESLSLMNEVSFSCKNMPAFDEEEELKKFGFQLPTLQEAVVLQSEKLAKPKE
jgi:hypothetical protein